MRLPSPRTATDRGVHEGRPYELWLPDADPPFPGLLILHGAGSRKENHADFARAASGYGWAALAFDQRGHGESDDEMSPAAFGDVTRMARFLAATDGVDASRVCVRGSSMGGWLAIHCAATSDFIAGAIAICPAGEQGLLRSLRRGELEMRADVGALEAWVPEHDVRDAVELMGGKPLILIHARGDETIPYTWSEELYERAAEPRKLIVIPGGHHRSAQHDPELHGVALRWLERELRAARSA
jgi:alpha-beta hydrolase superfamily lysophospholipase